MGGGIYSSVRAAGDDAVETMNKGFLWSLAVSRERVWEENDSGARRTSKSRGFLRPTLRDILRRGSPPVPGPIPNVVAS